MMRSGVLLALAAAAALAAQPRPSASVVIVSPQAGGLVAGPTILRAEVRPPGAGGEGTRVVFYVDGREVCAASAPPFECEWTAGRDVVAHVIRAVAVLGTGERVAHTVRTRGLGYVDKVSVDALQITVVVTDRDGRFVQGLPQAAFRVLEDGKPQRMSTFQSGDVPLELVAALDVSQSMTPAMSDLKQAARTFLGALGPNEQVTLLAFNDNVFTLARKATAPAAKARAVDRLAPWGGTALYDVIIRGMDMLGRQVGRRALVVFSDGEDQSSRATEAAAIERVEASDATVYTVGLGKANDQPALRALLQRIATVSGGRGLIAESAPELERAFGEIVGDLSHQYLLGYQPANQQRDGKWRKIEVQVTGGHQVRHRLGYRIMPERSP
jgi:Ca-activated chloride channel family protein